MELFPEVIKKMPGSFTCLAGRRGDAIRQSSTALQPSFFAEGGCQVTQFGGNSNAPGRDMTYEEGCWEQRQGPASPADTG